MVQNYKKHEDCDYWYDLERKKMNNLRKVGRLIKAGYTQVEISVLMDCSLRQVSRYVQQIKNFNKLRGNK